MLEGLTFRFSLGTAGLGRAFTRRCAIPQGCPIAQMAVALLTRSWTVLVRKAGAIPRALADDLSLISTGETVTAAVMKVHAATRASVAFLDCIGARLAITKSYGYASSKPGRDSLRLVLN